jgi:hypothetical protein
VGTSRRGRQSFTLIEEITKRSPRTDLLAEIGTRVSNTKNYSKTFEKAGKNTSIVPKFAELEKKSFDKP